MVNAELREELLHLDAESRAALARELIASLDDLSEAEIEGLWLDEARRRDREIDRGEAGTEPADALFARLKRGY